MYEPETTPKLLAIRLSGKLGRADYERLYPSLREQLAEPLSAVHPGGHGQRRGR